MMQLCSDEKLKLLGAGIQGIAFNKIWQRARRELDWFNGSLRYLIGAITVICDPDGPGRAEYRLPLSQGERIAPNEGIRDGKFWLTLGFPDSLPIAMDG